VFKDFLYNFRDFTIGDEVLRQFVIRPDDVTYEFIEYQNADQDLQPGLTTTPAPSNNNLTSPFVALKLQFSLPAGAYATMALRELLRYDFSSAYQKTNLHEDAEILSVDE